MSGKINASVHPALHLARREKTGLQGRILGKDREKFNVRNSWDVVNAFMQKMQKESFYE